MLFAVQGGGDVSDRPLALSAGEPPINFRAHEIRAGNVAGARDDFESMLQLLVQATYPGARLIAANPGDWGIDVLVGDLAGQIVIWQAKYFMPTVTRGQQNQIRESFASAVKAASENRHKVRQWVLCVPSNMDAPTDKWWTGWKKRSEKQFGIKIELWHEGELRRRLISPDAADIRRHYYDAYRPGVVDNVRAGLERPAVVPIDDQRATDLETALFVRQLREAKHRHFTSAKLEFFNAELLAREVVDKNVAAEVNALVEADATVYSIWEATFNEVCEQHTTGVTLPGLHSSVMKQVRNIGECWPSELRSTAIHRCGMMHRIVEDGRAGWVPHWEDVVHDHRGERRVVPNPRHADTSESAEALT